MDRLRPRVVLIENVPGIVGEPRFRSLLRRLDERYRVQTYTVQATDFGIPQRRRRLIAFAIDRDLDVQPPDDLVRALPSDFDTSQRTSGEALDSVTGLAFEVDPLHRARRLRPKTLERVRAVSQGQGRRDLPTHLRLGCHSRLSRIEATAIYGRIDPARPAPTMTTRCTTPSCGRFIHPTEDRGLTLREAAILQTFPPSYRFLGGYDQIERQIGNALPPRLAEALGLIVVGSLRE